MSGAAAPRQDRFTLLDGMRGLAALVVITDHIHSPLLESALPGRYLAVDFFFALSGFVIAHVYTTRFEQGLSAGGFMLRRFLRLYPLYLAALVLSLVLVVLKMSAGWLDASRLHVFGTFGFNLVYLPAPPGLTWVADDPFPFNGPSWSLFFELVVNAVFGVIVLKLSRSLLLAIIAAGAAGVVATAFTLGKLDSGFLWSNFPGGFARVAYAFFVGVLIYRLRAAWRAPALPPLLSFLALLAIFAVPTSAAWRPAWDAFAAIALFPLLIMFSANRSVRGGVAQACAWAGLMSYGFYVLQVPMRDWVDAVLAHTHVDISGFALVALVSAVTLAAASILHVLYDVPVRRFLSRVLLQPRSALTAAD